MTIYKNIKGLKKENIVDTGTEGTKVALGTTAQRGSTQGQFRYNSTTGKFEGYDGTEFEALESPVGLTSITPISITPAENAAGGNSFTLTGAGFKSGATVKFIGTDDTEFNASSVTFNNSTSLTAVMPTVTEALEPFDVKVTNPSSNSAQIDNQIQINTSPVWVTAAGTIATIDDDATGTHATVNATDADGETVTYAESTSVLSSAGLSLNTSSGAISGDPTNVDANTTYTFGIDATDLTDTVNRSFNIIVNKIDDGSTSARAAVDADALYSLGITTAGVYYIINSGVNIPVWCDFTQSEGYMLALSVDTANPETADVWNTSSGSDVEIGASDTSPQDTDVVSQIRRNRVFQKLMFKYENTNWSPVDKYYTAPVIYDNGSNVGSGLTALGTNTLISRAVGNTGRLIDTACSSMSTENLTRVRINATFNNARPTMLSNYDTDGDNQSGFFYISGVSYNYGDNFIGNCTLGTTSKWEVYIK